MSNTGFGQYPGEPGPGGIYEQRTSVMAILSLVCGLICFIPGLAVLGALFGVASLVAISRSGERLTGRGLAVAGLIISFLVLALHIGIYFGIGWGWRQFHNFVLVPYNQSLTAIDAGDIAQARTALSADANKRISDADFDAFRAQYQGELGHFVSIPDSPMKVWEGYARVQQQAQQIQGGRNDAFPVPANFDNGTALVVFQFDPNSTPPSGTNPKALPIANIMIMAPSGNKWTLYDPQRGSGTPGKQPATKPSDTKPPETKPPESTPPDTTPPKPDDKPAEPPKEPGTGPG
jgi:hypothetical protein